MKSIKILNIFTYPSLSKLIELLFFFILQLIYKTNEINVNKTLYYAMCRK